MTYINDQGKTMAPLFTAFKRPDERTAVYHESTYQFGAPHTWEVVSAESKELLQRVHFQEGPIKEHGLNGLQTNDLLLIAKTTLEYFQNSEFKSRENALAITHIEEALHWLNYRTAQRVARQVEGTSTV
jgi:hypothetical protein